MTPPELIVGIDAEVARWVGERIAQVRGGDFGACAGDTPTLAFEWLDVPWARSAAQ